MVILKLFKSKPVLFALGAASAASWNVISPILGNVVRPVLKEAIKTGIILQKQVQTIAQEAWQDVEDLTAEAKAEVDAGKKPTDKKDTAA
ncbi:MAG TPA: DUF5132 domain-containing protein [Candidatus Binatia bacterium]|jgi:hypothetical protein